MQDKISNKIVYLLQWVVFLIMLLPAFLTSPKATQASKALPSASTNSVSQQSQTQERPLSLTDIQTYSDAMLTIKAKKTPVKAQLNSVKANKKELKLTDGVFIKTSKDQASSDITKISKTTNQVVYTVAETSVFYKPLTTYDNLVYETLSAGMKVKVDKTATTNFGNYYRVLFDDGTTGWIDAKNTTSQNPKIEKVQALLDQKYNKPNYSIYVKDIDSGFTAGVNQSQKMYSASLSKLPILYWAQKQVNQGSVNLNDQLVYSEQVNGWTGAFQPEGTGLLPKTADDKPYSLLDLINRTAKDSDNVASNIIAYYQTKQFSADFQSDITTISGEPWNPVGREASAEMVGRVLAALYNEGGNAFDALVGTDYDADRIPANLPKTLKIAHKIGTAYEFNHDAAFIFTDDPYILVIETNNNADSTELAEISKDIYEVMK
ncbi:class A beta-lactamase-related serine hydrolase [Lactococcus piscium]|uniref:Class A beta-lactamase-related serine hydrolase n=2 Tax=Pseudolactococcus paracarnosus TaxID=2749962 RepID=A0ABT0AKU3_9LACT|nr:class A beta-lactamase-related serine hydrolase [Lactococcus paracarnosus]MCJ1977174.1 class A beta-lactamase-related serine hydrolase [Lactococcus paracarnosus]MCJ1983330.1 class A beta-lactamase-related serine hydrolase [Lactococcus paracarnosus]MCJ1998551.1 class A beta-lactamase-related serine hydrolase [Lactococcus paracarnosus]